jgi:uncharacterized membrane protein/DNA-binding MarR family transcriptional regulator
MCGLFLASMPYGPAENAPQAALHSGIAWGAAGSVSEASNPPSVTSLFAGADGTFSLCWEDNGLWHILLDAGGKPLTAARLLGHERPDFWAGSGSAPNFVRDPSGNLFTVWDSSGTEIHLRETDPKGRILVADRLVRSNPYGVHGPSISADGNGVLVGYTSYEPAFGEYRFALAKVDAGGQVASERFVTPGGGELLIDAAFLPSPDGDVHIVMSTLSGGLYLKVDPGGLVRFRVSIPLLGGSRLPVLASSTDGTVFLAWNGYEGQGSGRVYVSRISDTTAETIYITSSTDALSEPSLAPVPGGGVLVCWLAPGGPSRDVFYSTVGTDTWEAYPTVQRMGLAASPTGGPSVALGSGRLIAAWPSDTSVLAARGYSYGFELDAPPSPAVHPHGTASVVVELRNRGGLADTLTVSLDDSLLPPGWSAVLSTDEVALPAGDGTVPLTVLVTGPDAAAGPTDARLVIRCVSRGNPRLTQEITFPLTLQVDRRSEGTLSPRVSTAAPGAIASFDLGLSNLGDTDDELAVSAAGDGMLSVAVETPLVRLPWSGSARVSVRATVSPTATVGDVLQFTVSARSTASGELLSLGAAVVVTPGVQLRVSSPESSKGVLPGGTADFSILVGNDGNSPGPADVNLEVVSGSAGWSASISPSYIQLAAGDETEVSLTVTAPPLATGRLVVRVLATAREWDSSASTTITAVALPLHGLRAKAAPQRVSGLPGTALASRLSVTNTGTEADTIAAAFSLPAGWKADMRVDGALTDTVALGPGLTVSFDAAILPPPDAPAGEYPVRAILSGRADPSVAVEMTAIVEMVHDLSLDTPTPSVRAVPGETAVEMVRLRNLGNGPDNFTFGTEVPPGWTATVSDPKTGSSARVELPAGGNTELVLEVGVPYSAIDSWTDVHLWAVSQSGLRSVLTFRVGLLLPDLSVSVSYSPQPLTKGRNVLATVTVSNAGEAPARNVLVEFSVDGAAGQRERILLIPGGSSKTATFGWTPSAGSHLLRYEADPEHTILERDESDNVFLDRVDIAGQASAPAAPGPVLVAAAGGGIILIVVAAVGGGTETGRYWLLGLLFIPLYTKIKKDDVLDHFLRGQVYGYIKANPGEHYNSIKKALSLKNGTLVYHLKTLEREEFIKSIADGRFKRFYPKEMKVPEPSDELVLRMNHIQHEILRIIRENAGITQKEIAAKIGLSTPTIHYHINIMMSARVINVKRVGRETQCFVEEVEEGKAG